MGEVSLRHLERENDGGVSDEKSRLQSRQTDQIVRLDDSLDVFAMDTDSYTHEEMLGTFSHLAIDAEQVRPLKGLVAEIVLTELRQRG